MLHHRLRSVVMSGGAGSLHQYWRLVGTNNTQAFVNIYEVGFFDGANDISGQGASICSAGANPDYAFDGNPDSAWEPGTYLAGHWIGRNFGSPVALTQVTLQGGGNAYNNSRQIYRYWRIDWSDDGVLWHDSGATIDTGVPKNSFSAWPAYEVFTFETGL